jgi:ATP-dependent RNA helicase RhlE
MNFQELLLSEPLLRALAAERYEIPTPIQAQAIPPVMQGRDLVGCAQTGTGKTAAFALPILHRLTGGAIPASNDAHAPPLAASQTRHVAGPKVGGPAQPVREAASGGAGKSAREPHTSRRPIRSLVLAPTRELAGQILESFRTYGKNTPLRYTVVFGGVSQFHQTQSLKAGVDVLIATPGRLLDLMEQGFVDLRHVEVLVLDEADHMLDMGFIHDIRKIIAKLPAKRQNLLFSATMPAEIRELANSILRNPARVQVAAESAAADTVQQSVYFVAKRNKPVLLAHYLENNGTTRTLVFTRTKHGADRVVRHLVRAGIRALAIHGNKNQNARNRALADFKGQRPPVLVATDIAARGLDIDEVSHVVNYDVPNVPETYVHRIGRTGRAGASGTAVSFCDGDERAFLTAIERLTRNKINVREDQPPYPAQPAHGSDPSDRESRHDGRRHGGGERRSAPPVHHASPRPAHRPHTGATSHAPRHATASAHSPRHPLAAHANPAMAGAPKHAASRQHPAVGAGAGGGTGGQARFNAASRPRRGR